MKKVVRTAGFGTSEGLADQITLPNGKYYYTGVHSAHSWLAKERGWDVRVVRYFGACIYANINSRAHERFPIQIEEVDIKDFIDQVATEEEAREFLK